MTTWDITFNPRIDVNRFPRILELIVQIEAFRLSVLKIPLPPKVRKHFDEINIVRQIRGTTGIEGNTLSESEIEKVIGRATATQVDVSLEEQEVLNSEKTLCFIRELVDANPSGRIDEGLIRRLHELTTMGCNYPNNQPGEYRQHDVQVGEYHPPHHEHVPELMGRFVEFINARKIVEGYRPLIRAVLAHFYLISIHPFGDGNGRTSRALEAFVLYQGGYNVRGFYSLANFLYRNRQRYIASLQEARFNDGGDLNQFVIFLLSGFVQELQQIQEEILRYVRRVLFRDLYLEAAKHGQLNGRCLAVLEYLTFDSAEGIPLEAFKNRTHYLVKGLYEGKSPKTLLRDLGSMQKLGFLSIVGSDLTPNLTLMDHFN